MMNNVDYVAKLNDLSARFWAGLGWMFDEEKYNPIAHGEVIGNAFDDDWTMKMNRNYIWLVRNERKSKAVCRQKREQVKDGKYPFIKLLGYVVEKKLEEWS